MIYILLLFLMSGCLASENSVLKEHIRVLEIQNQRLNYELDLNEARVRELQAELSSQIHDK